MANQQSLLQTQRPAMIRQQCLEGGDAQAEAQPIENVPEPAAQARFLHVPRAVCYQVQASTAVQL